MPARSREQPTEHIGFAWSEQIFATTREVPIPTEQFSRVNSFIRACSKCAARKGGPCSRSVPVMSRYASSIDAISTSGENSCKPRAREWIPYDIVRDARRGR